MTRTKLCNRTLPHYTKGEEIFNMVSHITGGALGVVALFMCVALAVVKGDIGILISGGIYGVSLITLYTMSSIYHGLRKGTAKKVMQVLDHCTIFFLIGGSYTPVLLCGMYPTQPIWAIILLSTVWGFAILGAVFNAIDIKKYSKFSMACYIGMGWSIVMAAKPAIQSIRMEALLWLLLGGIAYTVGAVLYGVGKKHKYMHSVFHLFVVLGSVLQFVGIFFYIMM